MLHGTSHAELSTYDMKAKLKVHHEVACHAELELLVAEQAVIVKVHLGHPLSNLEEEL